MLDFAGPAFGNARCLDESQTVAIEYAAKPPYKLVRQYVMGEVIGEGSQGKVREAIDSRTLRRVAIKIVNLSKLRKMRNAEVGLQRELAIHQRLKHPYVVEMIERFMLEHKHKQYVVLEHVAGGSLQDLLDGTPTGVLPTGMARRFARQLFESVAYCHAQGVVHRDIKPANILVTADGTLKIADFGSAEELNRYDESDKCSKSKGSPAFQPPEVAAGNTSFSGFKVDVWACGVTLYRLLTGSVPFEGSSLMHLFENIAKGSFEMPTSILHDAQLVELLQALLTVDAEERLDVAAALRHPWLRENDDMRWGEHERTLVQSIARGSAASGKWERVLAAAAAAAENSATSVGDGGMGVGRTV
jgi:serine/threonine-protein kinase 11